MLASELSFDKHVETIKEADFVITHAGPGNIYLCEKFAKAYTVIPRRSHLNEHIDNHQVYFYLSLKQNPKIKYNHYSEQLKKIIMR